MILHIIF